MIFGIMTAPANATIDDTIRYADAAGEIFAAVPDTRFTFQLTFPDNGFGGMVLKPWGVRKTPTKNYLPVIQQKLAGIPGIRMFPVMPAALPGADNFPVSFVITSTADPERILEFAQELQGKAMQAHMFQFSDIDTKIDQPQSEIVFDHDKVASMGLDMQKVGSDMSAAIGGNYVNWFNIAGRSYKVIPQVKRIDRLNPEQLKDIYVTGPNNQLIPLSTVASIKHNTVARSLNRMQQLNAVTLSGVPTGSLDATLKFLENEAQKILPKGYIVDYTGESRQLHTEGSKFGAVFTLADRFDFSGPGGAVQQLPRSIDHSPRFSAARDFRRAALHFSKNAVRHVFHRSLYDDAQYLFGGWTCHAGRSRFKKRNSNRAICESSCNATEKINSLQSPKPPESVCDRS